MVTLTAKKFFQQAMFRLVSAKTSGQPSITSCPNRAFEGVRIAPDRCKQSSWLENRGTSLFKPRLPNMIGERNFQSAL